MILELVRTLRAGGGRTERTFLDFVADRQKLSTKVKMDLVTPLGWGVPAEQAKAIERLLGRAAPDLPSGRTSLYVCPECGDLGCGALGAFIEAADEAVVWRDFAFEAPGTDSSPMSSVGPFLLDRDSYVDVLEQQKVELKWRSA